MDVTIIGQHEQADTYIPKFQSLRTTPLLFGEAVIPSISESSLRSQQVIPLVRSKWKQITTYINEHGVQRKARRLSVCPRKG